MVNQKRITNLWRERGVLNCWMCKGMAKSGQSCGFKSITGYENKDLFKRRFYMNVAIMCQARSGQPGVRSGTFERCGIASGGGF